MPAWKPSEDGTKWKWNSCRYEMKTELYPASCEHLSIRNRIITVPGQWCRFQLIPASCERGLKRFHKNEMFFSFLKGNTARKCLMADSVFSYLCYQLNKMLLPIHINWSFLNYHSFSEPNIVWHGCKWNFAGPQIYLQPAKIKIQHFEVLLKFLVCNWKYCI